MSNRSFARKAIDTSSWYLRIASFVLTIVMGFSLALFSTASREARAVSQTAFEEALDEVDYKAVSTEPRIITGASGKALSRAELKALKLYPGGIPFGIKFITEGVLIVGICDVKSGESSVNPSSAAGLKAGDRIL